MTELIPRLGDPPVGDGDVWVSADFAAAFLVLHGQDYAAAQNHWERIVERVLNTDAVDPKATGRRAMRQAVRATVLLFERSDLKGRCPLCERASQGTGRPVVAPSAGEVSA